MRAWLDNAAADELTRVAAARAVGDERQVAAWEAGQAMRWNIRKHIVAALQEVMARKAKDDPTAQHAQPPPQPRGPGAGRVRVQEKIGASTLLTNGHLIEPTGVGSRSWRCRVCRLERAKPLGRLWARPCVDWSIEQRTTCLPKTIHNNPVGGGAEGRIGRRAEEPPQILHTCGGDAEEPPHILDMCGGDAVEAMDYGCGAQEDKKRGRAGAAEGTAAPPHPAPPARADPFRQWERVGGYLVLAAQTAAAAVEELCGGEEKAGAAAPAAERVAAAPAAGQEEEKQQQQQQRQHQHQSTSAEKLPPLPPPAPAPEEDCFNFDLACAQQEEEEARQAGAREEEARAAEDQQARSEACEERAAQDAHEGQAREEEARTAAENQAAAAAAAAAAAPAGHATGERRADQHRQAARARASPEVTTATRRVVTVLPTEREWVLLGGTRAHRTHLLRYAGQYMWCLTCGAYTGGRQARTLAAPCPKHLTAARKHSSKRLGEGKAPATNLPPLRGTETGVLKDLGDRVLQLPD